MLLMWHWCYGVHTFWSLPLAEDCSGVIVHDYIWKKHPDLKSNIPIDRLEHNCRSIQKYSFLECGGMCNLQPSKNSTVSMETACCQPNISRTTSVTFQCHPDVPRQRQIRVKFANTCSCVPYNTWSHPCRVWLLLLLCCCCWCCWSFPCLLCVFI